MSGTSYSEERIIDDNLDDPYDLGLTLEDTEDDFNIEDITEDQVKELLADEENRFLLDDDEVLESTSSQINIIDRRNNNEKPSGKGKSNDSKSFRNTGNLITIDCDDEDDEEESELDRRHSKFKSERVIRDVDKKLEEKDIPETLEAVVLDSKEPNNGPNSQPMRGNNNHTYHHQRGKSRNFMVPSARPFIGNNSLSSMGLLPTPLQSFNRIHVNPNFKHLAQGPRLGNQIEVNNFRHIHPRGGGGLHQPRLLGLPRQIGPRPVSAFEDISSSGAFPVNPIMDSESIEAFIASQSMEFEMEDPTSSHRFIPNSHNNHRPPLFSEPFVDNWPPNQGGIVNHQPWIKQPNRPSMGNFQRIPGIFNPESNLRAPFLDSFHRRMQMNNPLFGNSPRHPYMPNRLPHLAHPFFNQPNFSLIHPSMEGPRGRPPRLEATLHPVRPSIQRHQLQMPLGYSINTPTGMNQGQKRPQSSTNAPRLSTHHDNKRLNNLNSIASTSTNKQNLGHSMKTIHPFKAQDSSSSPQSINKVTSSPGQRVPRPSTSNVNLKNIRPIKTVNSTSTSSTTATTPATSLEARKAALLKAKAARRLLQKENMNRGVTSSVKQVEVVDLITSTTPDQQKEDTKEPNKDDQPIVVLDLDIDDEYKKKLEEQKRLREEIIRKKEERRKQMVAEKMKQTSASSTSSSTTPTPTSSNSTLTTGQQLRRTTLANNLIERASPSRDVQLNSDKRFPQSPLKRKSEEPVTTTETKSSPQLTSSDVKKVEIKGLAQTTTKATITKLCTSVGPIEDCVIEVTNAEKKAIVTFKSSQHARQFQSRYQRHLVDLCVIQVSLPW